MSAERPLRLVAFYLPQFHPIPENDRFWAPGFTDWDNVRRARPRFRGHDVPLEPGELGYYDLRDPGTREAQAALARAHGVHAFCYYHYWFEGRRLLERPFLEVLASGRPDFPFCLCWANEAWTRTWDGGDREVLVPQAYSDEDDVRHVEALLPAFLDARYLRVHGHPLLLVYRASRLPDPRRTFRRWRDVARAHGLEGLHLANVEGFPSEVGIAPTLGLDAAVEFAPDRALLGRRLRPGPVRRALRRLRGVRSPQPDRVLAYDELVRYMLDKPTPPYRRYPGVTPSWDNSPRRREGALIVRDATPSAYEAWLAEVVRRERRRPGSAPEDRLVFVNAWNEWGEGSRLEPCARHGRAYLEATARAVAPGITRDLPARPCGPGA